jgi:hypothetical protein
MEVELEVSVNYCMTSIMAALSSYTSQNISFKSVSVNARDIGCTRRVAAPGDSNSPFQLGSPVIQLRV